MDTGPNWAGPLHRFFVVFKCTHFFFCGPKMDMGRMVRARVHGESAIVGVSLPHSAMSERWRINGAGLITGVGVGVGVVAADFNICECFCASASNPKQPLPSPHAPLSLFLSRPSNAVPSICVQLREGKLIKVFFFFQLVRS